MSGSHLIAEAGVLVSQQVLPHLQLGQQEQGGGHQGREEEAQQGQDEGLGWKPIMSDKICLVDCPVGQE